MAKILHKIVIHSPVDKVFSFVTNPDNWIKYVTNLTEVRDISSNSVEPGTTFVWEYRMFGVKFHGKGRVTENIRNSRFGMKMEGGFPITETYAFTHVDGGTELAVEIAYEVPGKIMGAIAKRGVIEKINQKEAETVLEKVKLLCEEL